MSLDDYPNLVSSVAENIHTREVGTLLEVSKSSEQEPYIVFAWYLRDP